MPILRADAKELAGNRHADIQQLMHLMPGALSSAKAASTMKRYCPSWGYFKEWCAGHDLSFLPAAPLTVALYLLMLTQKANSFSTIKMASAAIAAFHSFASQPEVTTAPIVNAIREHAKRKLPDGVNKKEPLPWEKVEEVCKLLAERPASSGRLRNLSLAAAISLGFCGFLRYDDLSRLTAAQALETYYSASSPEGLFAPPQTSLDAQDALLAAVNRHLTPAQQQQGEGAAGDGSISLEVLSQALGFLPRGKAPGFDGLPYEFYQRFWEQLGPELTAVLQDAFQPDGPGQLPPDMTEGRITLLYKGKGLDRALPASYRPITLLNTDYKLAARVLADRLGPLLNHVVDSTQTGFLPQRWIGDNILAHLEIIAWYQRTQQPGALLFLDFEKAFDRLDRPWLQRCIPSASRAARSRHDTTVHASTPADAQAVLDGSIALHEDAMGARLQRSKSIGMGIGSLQHLVGPDQATGITFNAAGTDTLASLSAQMPAELYADILQRLHTRIARWSGFRLSLLGRAHVAKQVLVFMFTYHGTFSPVPEQLFRQLCTAV
ncbi:g4391 [Coccomyxa viridis]|uniref:G4391 protein n=1 Tax=Coccomyxa viridis TaxID=1274662 RepID=A0ABP1FQ80_9CHLO